MTNEDTREELTRLRQENADLKVSVEKWKDSWFRLRDILGRLWWHHPAIEDDAERAYFQLQLRSIPR